MTESFFFFSFGGIFLKKEGEFLESLSNDIQQESMKLREAFIHWVVCLVIFIGMCFLSELLAIIAYIAAGIYLNRRVLRKLIEWHPVHNTIDNVSSAKLGFFLLWPIRYFFLFMRLGITKVL